MPRKVDEQMIETVLRMVDRGYSVGMIANRIGVAWATVRGVLEAHGGPERARKYSEREALRRRSGLSAENFVDWLERASRFSRAEIPGAFGVNEERARFLIGVLGIKPAPDTKARAGVRARAKAKAPAQVVVRPEHIAVRYTYRPLRRGRPPIRLVAMGQADCPVARAGLARLAKAAPAALRAGQVYEGP